jgi:lysophospholipase L1-like esterase
MAGLVVAGVLVVTAVQLGPALVDANIPRLVRLQWVIGFLVAMEALYVAVLLACLIAVPVLGMALARARRKCPSRPITTARPVTAKLLLLSISTLFALLTAEGSVAAWRSWSRRAPALPAPRAPVEESAVSPAVSGLTPEGISLVVVGESSAEGVPYQDRLSIGEIVAWQLRRSIPGKQVRVEVQARAGKNMAQMHEKFARMSYRPDVVIVYAGHNEFSSRFSWSHGIPYYADMRRSQMLMRLERFAAWLSPVCGLIQETAEVKRVSGPPPPWITRRLIDVPVCTPEEYAARRADFRTRLDAIASYCQREKVLTVLVIPPANDAGYEPNRSALSPETSAAERSAFEREFQAARAAEATDPRRSIDQYRAMLARQPGFAEAHFRLARLLEQAEDWDAAYRHYVSARDLDGLPMRCPSDFQDIYREVAGRRGAMLVDGQALFHSFGTHGLLDDELFNDTMHPSLRGHIALAQAVVDQLRARSELGWPAGGPDPAINPVECASHFGMNAEGWIAACQLSMGIWNMLAFVRYDPRERLAKARRLGDAIHLLRAGRRAEELEIPGLGVGDALLAEPPRLDHTPLHHREEPRAVFQHGDVGQDIAVDDQDVGELAGLDGPELVDAAHDLGAGLRGAGDHFHRRQPDVLDEEGQLLGVITVRVPGKPVVATHAESAAGAEDHPGALGTPFERFLVAVND